DALYCYRLDNPRNREHGRPRDASKNHSRMDGPSEGKATDRRTGCGIRQKGGPAKRVPSQSARSIPEVSARSVPETNWMASAARWEIVIRRLSPILRTGSHIGPKPTCKSQMSAYR